jgi:hypothetical protein
MLRASGFQSSILNTNEGWATDGRTKQGLLGNRTWNIYLHFDEKDSVTNVSARTWKRSLPKDGI